MLPCHDHPLPSVIVTWESTRLATAHHMEPTMTYCYNAWFRDKPPGIRVSITMVTHRTRLPWLLLLHRQVVPTRGTQQGAKASRPFREARVAEVPQPLQPCRGAGQVPVMSTTTCQDQDPLISPRQTHPGLAGQGRAGQSSLLLSKRRRRTSICRFLFKFFSPGQRARWNMRRSSVVVDVLRWFVAGVKSSGWAWPSRDGGKNRPCMASTSCSRQAALLRRSECFSNINCNCRCPSSLLIPFYLCHSITAQICVAII